MPAHQGREVDAPLVRGRVGAVVVAELAVEAEFVDFVETGHRHALDLAIGCVDQFEESREGRAEREAAAALVADFARAPEFALELLWIAVVRVPITQLCGRNFRRRNLHRNRSESRSIRADVRVQWRGRLVSGDPSADG